MDNFEEFYCFMSEYTSFFEQVASVEEEKMSSLLSNDIKRIENFLSEYQVTIKKTEQYENKRKELHIKLGLEGKSFKDVVDMCNDDEKEKLSKVYTRFKIAVNNVKHYNNKSLEIAKINLQSVKGSNSIFNNIDACCYDTNGDSKDTFLKNVKLLNKKI